uniref:Na,K-ATPase beta x n=1 Tax=Oncopeltus fasciatus TaxID=7536 RepID=A0A8S4MU67_ONCFA|nr:Na,K-ATPase beta x [Oncopeltus fasciatus]
MKHLLAVLFCFLQHSLGDQITLKVHPLSEDSKSTLIWFNSSTYDRWAQQLDNFLEVYRNPTLTDGREENLVTCNYNKYPSTDSVCNIRPEEMKPCTASNFFGYKSGTPCVFIELEKVLGWKPKYFSSGKSLPKTMPKNLKEKILETTEVNLKMWETIWLSCDGETPADKEMIGPIQILPQPGFPGYFFPYIGQPGYLNPVVAVHFERPLGGLVINIVCKAWAPGIIHDMNKPLGVARFELLID